jgi:hypothetical protein
MLFTVDRVLSIVYCVLCTVYALCCGLDCGVCTVYVVVRGPFSRLFNVYCNTVYCTLSTV